MKTIATYNNINSIKPFNPNTKSVDINQFIFEVENLDVIKMLGNSFYTDIINNIDNYTNLLEPLEYEYGGYTYRHNGLYYVISYLTHEVYLNDFRFKDTPSGTILHNNDYSDRIQDQDRKNLASKYRQLAYTAFEEVKCYLDRHTNDYPLWCVLESPRTKRTGRPYKIHRIR